MPNHSPQDGVMIREYLDECREHLAMIEADLLLLERSRGRIDEHQVNRVFRAAHSIKGGASLLGLAAISRLAHQTENALELVRSGQLCPTSDTVDTFLQAFDTLAALIEDYQHSDECDIAQVLAALAALDPGNERTRSVAQAQKSMATAFPVLEARNEGEKQ
jgi:two-component system, chemotaxis family, sensor kinase CheA